MGIGRKGARYQELRRKWILASFLCADLLVLWDESEEDLGAMVGCFVEVCKRRGNSMEVRAR